MEEPVNPWTPTDLTEFVGQTDLIRQLDDEIVTAVSKNRPLPHMIFDGQPGLGKTTLVNLIQTMTRRKLYTRMGGSFDINAMTEVLGNVDDSGYTKNTLYLREPVLAQPFILFIDECEQLKRNITENFHYVMEPGADGRFWFMAKVPRKTGLKKCVVTAGTIILACNYLGDFSKVGKAMLNRCPIKYTFQPYSPEQIMQMVMTYAGRTDFEVTNDAAMLIANRSLGIPRNAVGLLNRTVVRLDAQIHRNELDPGKAVIDSDVVESTCELLGIDSIGLTQQHRQYLQALASSGGGIASLDVITSILRTEKETIKMIERDLFAQQFVVVSSTGRQITEKGLVHLNPDNIDPVLSRLID